MPAPDPETEPTPNSASEKTGFRAPEALITGMLLGFVGLGLLLIVIRGTDIEWSWAYWGSNDGTFDRSVIFRNFGLLILALIALPLAIWRSLIAHNQARIASKQHHLSEKGLIIDRFQKGAQMLESNEFSVRLAGIYALKELVKSDPDDTYIMVLDLLYDFVRERSKNRKPNFAKVSKDNPNPSYGPFPPDLQKALETASWLRDNITLRNQLDHADTWSPDLRQANLSGASLPYLNLSHADLKNANLSRIILLEAKLPGARLSFAQLTNAQLYKTDLSCAYLLRANLMNAVLMNTNLNSANLVQTNLTRANLTSADLTYARLKNASLNRTVLKHANLARADLQDADLICTDLKGACLTHADLGNTRLIGVNLSKAKLFCKDLSCRESIRAWAWQNQLPTDMPTQVKKAIVIRKADEQWPNFVDRIMRTRPELGWTDDMKVVVWL